MLKNWIPELFPRVRSFVFGFTLPYSALRLILSHRSLLFWSLLPVAVTLAIYVYLLQVIQAVFWNAMLSAFAAWGWSPEGWAAWLIQALTSILLIFVGAVTFSFVASVVASPFNDLLAEATEKWAAPPLPPVTESSWGNRLRLIAIDVGKSVAATIATLIALVLSWIPVVNLIAFAVAFLLICFQYISYPQTRRGIGLGGGVRFLWRHSYACLGFGSAVSLLFALPLISGLCLPLAVVGGTLLVARAPGQRESGLLALR